MVKNKIDDKNLLLGMDSKEVSNYIYNLLLTRINHNYDVLLPESLSFIPFYSEASFIPPFFQYTMSQYIGFNNIINSNAYDISKKDGKAYMAINLNDENGILYDVILSNAYLEDMYKCVAERLILLRKLNPEERIFVRSDNILSLHNVLVCKNEETFNILKTKQFKFTRNQFNDYYQSYKIHFTDERVIYIDPEESFNTNTIDYPLADHILYPNPVESKVCKFCGNHFFTYEYNKNQEYCNLYCYPENIVNTDSEIDIPSKFYKTYHNHINTSDSNSEFLKLTSRDSILKEIKSLEYSLSNLYDKYKSSGNITLDDITAHLSYYGLYIINDLETKFNEQQFKYLYDRVNRLNDFNRVRLYKPIS